LHTAFTLPLSALQRLLSQQAAVRLLQRHEELHVLSKLPVEETQRLAEDIHALDIPLPGSMVGALLQPATAAQEQEHEQLHQTKQPGTHHDQKAQQQHGEGQDPQAGAGATEAGLQLTTFAAQELWRLFAQDVQDATDRSGSTQDTTTDTVPPGTPAPVDSQPHTSSLMAALHAMLKQAEQLVQEEKGHTPTPPTTPGRQLSPDYVQSVAQLLAQLQAVAPRMNRQTLSTAIQRVSKLYTMLAQQSTAASGAPGALVQSVAATAAVEAEAKAGRLVNIPEESKQQQQQQQGAGGHAQPTPNVLRNSVHSFLAKAEQVMLRNTLTEAQARPAARRVLHPTQAVTPASATDLTAVGSVLKPKTAQQLAVAVKHMTEAGYR
jgi:hypothetical protein